MSKKRQQPYGPVEQISWHTVGGFEGWWINVHPKRAELGINTSASPSLLAVGGLKTLSAGEARRLAQMLEHFADVVDPPGMKSGISQHRKPHVPEQIPGQLSILEEMCQPTQTAQMSQSAR